MAIDLSNMTTDEQRDSFQLSDEAYLSKYGETKEQSVALYDQRKAEQLALAEANDTGFFGLIKESLSNPVVLGILAAALAPGIGNLISSLSGLTAAEAAAAFIPSTAESIAAATGLSVEAATVAATAAASGADIAAIASLAAPIEQLVVTGALAGGGAVTTAQIAAATAAAVTAAATSGSTTVPISDLTQNLVTAAETAATETVPSMTVTGAAGGAEAGLTAAQTAALAAGTAGAGAGLLTGGGVSTGGTTAVTTPTGETIPSLTVTGASPTGGLLTPTLAGATAAGLASTLYPTSVPTTIPSLEVLGTKPTGIVPTLAGASAATLANSVYPGTFTGPTMTVTGTTPTSGLTTGQLTALGLAGAGALSLNNTGPTGQSTDTVGGGGITDLLTKYGPTALGLLGSGLSTANAYSAGQKAQDIFNTQAGTLTTAAKAVAPGYQFSPIGMTTRFGTATPKFDASGKLISYDYGATADVAAQRDQLLKLSQQALPSTTNPQDIISNYISQQQGLLAPGQAQDLARIQAQLAATGRSGLGTGAVAGTGISPALAATNPQLAAYYNSLAQQNQLIASQAPTYAQNLLNAQITTSGNLFGQAKDFETAAQQPLLMGQQLGGQITAGTTAASNAAYKAAQDAATLKALGAQTNLYTQTEAQNALIKQLTGSTSETSGLTGLLNAGIDIAKLIPSFFGSGVTTVGSANTGATTTGATTTGATTTGTTTLPTKLLSGGGTTVVGGTGAGVTATNRGGTAAFGTNGALVSAIPQYDATGKVIGYNYGNTGATTAATNGLLTAATGANTLNLSNAVTPNTLNLSNLTMPTTPSTRAPTAADVYAAYMNNPKAKAANPFGPDPQALQYWMNRGLSDFNKVVAAY